MSIIPFYNPRTFFFFNPVFGPPISFHSILVLIGSQRGTETNDGY